MAVKLPKHTWSSQTVTLKGFKTVVYSTVTGQPVGEIRDGKFVQTADKIPVPAKKKPKTVTVPDTARAGGIENTIASYERDRNYYKTIAEDPDSSPSERNDARKEFDRLGSQIAKLQGDLEQFTAAEKEKTVTKSKVKAKEDFDKLKSEYQTLEREFSLLLNPNTDPKANSIRTRMNKIINESLDLYKTFSGVEGTVENVKKLLAGTNLPGSTTINAPTGNNAPVTTQKTPAETGVTSGTVTKKPVTSGTANVPSKTTGTPAAGSFNVGTFRAADEASMAGLSSTTGNNNVTGAANVPTSLQTLLKKTEFWYDLPDYIFETVPGLGDLLVKAVNENWDDAKFLAAAKLTPWWQSNSAIFRDRLISKAKYNELRAAGNDVSKTEYGQYLAKQIRNVKTRAKQIAGVTLDDAQAQQIAEKIYDGNLDEDTLAVDRLIIPFIGKVTDRYAGTDVATYGGQALQSYQMLQAIAKANGLALKDILPQISTATTGGDLEKAVLQGLASGDIDIARVAQNARMVAAQGQPEYVRNLLNQGYDLEQVYAPYKTTMATLLELNPDQIDLNDATLRSAINNNGDMNVYDFKKVIRRDPRWQYTQNARDDMSSTALNLLRNFGFQG